jgi:excisionase family DNA binding protein
MSRMTITVGEAAEMLGISRTSAYLCARRREIPTVRLGRRVLVPVARFMAMLEADPTAGRATTTRGRASREPARPTRRPGAPARYCA